MLVGFFFDLKQVETTCYMLRLCSRYSEGNGRRSSEPKSSDPTRPLDQRVAQNSRSISSNLATATTNTSRRGYGHDTSATITTNRRGGQDEKAQEDAALRYSPPPSLKPYTIPRQNKKQKREYSSICSIC